MAQTGEALMAGNTPRGIRKRVNGAGQPRYQVRYLLRPEKVGACPAL